MSKNSANDFSKAFNLIIDASSDVYEENYEDALDMLIEHSEQQEIDEGLGHKAGKIFVLLYDISGAIGKKSLKSGDILKILVHEISSAYGVKGQGLWNIFKQIPLDVRPDDIFFKIYQKLDQDFKYDQKITENDDTVEGFRIVSNNAMSQSNIAYLFDNISTLTTKK